MKRYRSRLFLLAVAACLTACATPRMPEERSPLLGTTGRPLPPQVPQPAGSPTPRATPAAPAVTLDGYPIATELPPEVKRLIDGVRRLHEQPGLILDREAIYKTLGVKAASSVSWQDGGRSMEEGLRFERAQEYADWRGSLKYSELPERESWNVRIEFLYGKGPNCYPSRLVESYWGKPFVYRPLGVHGLVGDLVLKQRGMPATGPHDGAPYNAEFHAPHANSAGVIFFIGPGGCLITVRASNIFKLKEYSDDNIYHQ